MTAMDRVRAEQAKRAEVIGLLEEWEKACTLAHGGNASEKPLTTVALLITAGDKLQVALADSVLGVRLNKKEEKE